MGLIPADAVKVTGLRELQEALKAINGEAQKEIRLVLNAAIGPIAEEARRGVPRRSGRAATSIKVQSGQREARIKAGGARAAYYPWLDFGGTVGRGRSVDRPFRPEGRYLYPAYRRRREDMVQAVAAGLVALIERHGLDVT